MIHTSLLALPIGRIVFASVFALSFFVLLFFSYKKDTDYIKQNYANLGFKMMLGILCFFGVLFLLMKV